MFGGVEPGDRVGVMLSLEERQVRLVMRIFGMNGEQTSFELSEEIARGVREQLNEKIELIEVLRESGRERPAGAV
jgi:hypothetical protein